ncbi:hypothetical protein K2C03_004340 [Vibrio vulnificus]|nr:hypothetical protein [Vibrio vulnificus]
MTEQRFPNQEERSLIGEGVLITKVKYNDNNIQPIYHKWKDIWDDDKKFIVKGSNPDYIIRAISVTLPMYFLDDPSVREWTYRGYVAGLAQNESKNGDVQIFPLSEVSWV